MDLLELRVDALAGDGSVLARKVRLFSSPASLATFLARWRFVLHYQTGGEFDAFSIQREDAARENES